MRTTTNLKYLFFIRLRLSKRIFLFLGLLSTAPLEAASLAKVVNKECLNADKRTAKDGDPFVHFLTR